MAVELLGAINRYQGLSGDVKPTTGVKTGSTFYETDTRLGYVYDGAAWVQDAKVTLAGTLPAFAATPDVTVTGSIPTGANVIGGIVLKDSSGNEYSLRFSDADGVTNTRYALRVDGDMYAFNNNTWERVRSVNTGQLVTTVKSTAGTEPGIGSSADGTNNAALYTNSYMAGWAGANMRRVRVESVFKPVAPANVNNGAAATLWTPATDKKPRLMRAVVTSSGAGEVHLRTGTAGSGTLVVPLHFTGAGTFIVKLGQGRLATTANDVWEIYNNSGGALTLGALLVGTEES